MAKLVMIFGIALLSYVSCQNTNKIPEPPEELKSIPPPPEAIEIELDDKRSTNETETPIAVRGKCSLSCNVLGLSLNLSSKKVQIFLILNIL